METGGNGGPTVNAANAAHHVAIKNVLFATDFSDASHNALTCALSLARAHDAKIHALHVVTPEAYVCATPGSAAVVEALEESVEQEMEKVAARMCSVRNETIIERSISIWTAVEEIIQRDSIDLVVVGTHGRTGVRKMVLGSTAEAIFRRARVPVLTIGPAVTEGMHSGGKYHNVLLATDLQEDALSAAALAFSIAEEQGAKLVLLHAVAKRSMKEREQSGGREKHSSAANILHELHELIPVDAEIWCRPEVVLKFGEPVREILGTAKEKDVDLIVMGTHGAEGRATATTHLGRGVSYDVVVRSRCPVLTVRG
jgi:nucleotide-binding universal stress UspA family protein